MKARTARCVLLAALAALLLAACGHSPRTQFFTLGVVRASQRADQYVDAPAQSVPAQDASAHYAPVQLRAVHIPEVLDRLELVSSLSGGRLQIDQFSQWGSPMEDMVRSVLSQDLAERLPAGMVIPAQAPAPPDSQGLVVDVQEFEPEADGRVVLDAAWTLLAKGPSRGLYQQRRFALAAGSSASEHVQAMSRLLGQLADAVAQSVRSV